MRVFAESLSEGGARGGTLGDERGAFLAPASMAAARLVQEAELRGARLRDSDVIDGGRDVGRGGGGARGPPSLADARRFAAAASDVDCTLAATTACASFIASLERSEIVWPTARAPVVTAAVACAAFALKLSSQDMFARVVIAPRSRDALGSRVARRRCSRAPARVLDVRRR